MLASLGLRPQLFAGPVGRSIVAVGTTGCLSLVTAWVLECNGLRAWRRAGAPRGRIGDRRCWARAFRSRGWRAWPSALEFTPPDCTWPVFRATFATVLHWHPADWVSSAHIMSEPVPMPPAPKKESFWTRQWAPTPTTAQFVFDLLFGIIGPIACLTFDPFIFNGQPETCNTGVLYAQRTVLLTAIWLGMGALCLTLVVGSRLGRWAALLAGICGLGTLTALAFGVLLLPLSVIFTFAMGIGLIGFVPLLTAFAFARNTQRAWQWAHVTTAGEPSASHSSHRLVLAAVGIILVLGLSGLVQALQPVRSAADIQAQRALCQSQLAAD